MINSCSSQSFFFLIYIFYWSIVHSKVIQLYIYTHIIFEIIFHYWYYKTLTRVPVPYSKPLLLIANVSFKIRNLVFYPYKSNKWNQNVINFLARQKFLSFLKYMYILFMYIYTKAFLLHLIKAWERTQKRRWKNWKT